MKLIESIVREVRDARTTDRPILHIRVTADAISGSVVTMPLTPERLRALKPYVVHLQGRDAPDVFADPKAERALEIVVHPEDWTGLLADLDAIAYIQLALRPGEPTRVMGIPVTDSAA